MSDRKELIEEAMDHAYEELKPEGILKSRRIKQRVIGGCTIAFFAGIALGWFGGTWGLRQEQKLLKAKIDMYGQKLLEIQTKEQP